MDAANFWNKAGFLWPFFVVLVLHFSLVYTESGWLKHKLTYVALYLPAVVFAVTDLTTELINGPVTMEWWGYEDTSPATWVYGLSTFWVALLPVLALLVCMRYSHKVSDEMKKTQSKLVTIGFAIPILVYIITNAVFPALSIEIPNLGHIAVGAFALLASYAIMKYDWFTFDAALAAENIISTMPDSLVLADIRGNMLRINKRLVNFLGYQEDELKGQPIAKLFLEEKFCSNLLEELAEKRLVRNYELTLRTKSEEQRVVLFSGSIVKSKTGRDIGMTCIIHDITDRKEIEQRLVKAERLASIGELAGQVGHDLRNPLTGIKSGAYFLKKKGNTLTDSDREKVLEMIDNAVEDSNRIINSLVDYSGELNLEMEKSTPKTIMARALSRVRIPGQITILDRTEDEPQLLLDVSRMESVFISILQNALESITGNGTIEVHSTKKDANVEITFVDSGAGIPENILAKVFSPLTTTKAKGMGLGLATCKRIVDAHGGRITVESALGKGTTVTIVLPSEPHVEFVVRNDSAPIVVPDD